MKFQFLVLCIAMVITFSFLSEADAARYRFRSARSSYSTTARFGGARPVTGYGSNIHRNAILRQEAKRASRGYPVRRRGNIIWYR